MNNNKKTAAIVSLYGNSNFGNKLQNYAGARDSEKRRIKYS